MADDILKGSSMWRMVLDTETDYDSPGSEELNSQFRENIECLLHTFGYTGYRGTINTISTGSTSVISCATAIASTADEHNGRRCIITSGNGKGMAYKVSTHQTTNLTLSSADVEADGVSTGDNFAIFYDYATGAHDHDGVNSKSVVLADSVITQAKLKTSIGYVGFNGVAGSSGNFSTVLHLAGSSYAFFPQTKLTGAHQQALSCVCMFRGGTAKGHTTSYDLQLFAKLHQLSTSQAFFSTETRYVTTSGELHWIFILRKKESEAIQTTWYAVDHPCFGGEDKNKETPFAAYLADEEIICINPSEEIAQEIIKYSLKNNKDFIEGMWTLYEIDEDSNPPWPDGPVTIGLPKCIEEDGKFYPIDWRTMPRNTLVEPIKKVIPKPNYVITKALKRKQAE